MHGAGEEPAVWDGWDGWAVDLQAGLDVEHASLLNYEAVVTCDAWLAERPLCLVGRGMGALVVQLAARRVGPAALVLVEPWPPEAPSAHATRPESPLVLEECRRWSGAPQPEAPLLVLGNRAVADRYAADELDAPHTPAAVTAWARSVSA